MGARRPDRLHFRLVHAGALPRPHPGRRRCRVRAPLSALHQALRALQLAAALPARHRPFGPPGCDAYTCLVSPWIKYSVIRLVLFAGVLAALLLLTNFPVWLSAVVAAIVGFCISYIFFRPQRDEVAASIASRRAAGDKNADADEDSALDSGE